MSEKIEREAVKGFQQKEALAKTMQQAVLGGAPQLNRRERSQLLGQLRERLLWGATEHSLKAPQAMEAFKRALEHKEAQRLLVRSDYIRTSSPFVKLAVGHGVSFSYVQSPEFKGNVAMVLVADSAVDVPEAIVEN